MYPSNLIDVQRACAAKRALQGVDAELAVTTYPYDRDRLLEQRHQITEYQAALAAGLIPHCASCGVER